MLKIKHSRTADVVLHAYRVHKSGQGVGSLLLGLYDADGNLMPVGGASAFSNAKRLELIDELAPLVMRDEDGEVMTGEGERSRFSASKDVSFVKLRPERVMEVKYDQMEGWRFRHAVQFLRWRDDRDPLSCTYDQLETPAAYDLSEVLASSRSFLARLGCTRGGSPGIFGCSGGIRQLALAVLDIALPPLQQRVDRAARSRRSPSTDRGGRARSRTVNAVGVEAAVTSSQSSGVDTVASGRARALYAAAIVRSRAAWLKSMKTRSPRSSFHHAVVTASGMRRSSSRAAEMTACRTPMKSCSASIGAYTCSPLLPEVLMKAVRPASVEDSQFERGGHRILEVLPGCGSRSSRS